MWQPATGADTALARFAFNAGFENDWDGLQRFSVDNAERFWPMLWDFLGVAGARGDIGLVTAQHLSDVRFFPEARLNYAHNLLRGADEAIAIIAHQEGGGRRQVTYGALRAMVAQIATALFIEGVGQGDRVAGVVPNCVEAVAFYLASASLGAVWASCSPDFGVSGIVDRLGQIAPKVLVAANGYSYGGKRFDLGEKITASVVQIPSIKQVVVFAFDGDEALPAHEQTIWFDDWIAPHKGTIFSPTPLAFDHPLVVLFSSGTTGKPKCLIHRAGGLLITHMKEQQLHGDIGAGDRLLYFTTCGWMMWNWQVSALASGTTLVLFDGNPFHPSPMRLYEIAEQERVTHFGTSARYIDACLKADLRPRDSADLGSVRAVFSTGSPLVPTSFDWVFDALGDVHLASISGGTDICGCFVGGWPVKPVYRGEIQGPMLGLDVDVVDETGQSIIGEPGELVCRNAHPSMPLGLWGDFDGTGYKAAYFDRFDNVWAQGDWAVHTHNGGFIILGRSDATLNPGGVRIGTAEIYRQLASISEIVESVAVGREIEGDVEVWLFVKLAPHAHLDAVLEQTIRSAIRVGASPRHVPQRILAIPEIPVTRSGKVSEIAVRDALHGRIVQNTSALANPEALQYFTDILA